MYDDVFPKLDDTITQLCEMLGVQDLGDITPAVQQLLDDVRHSTGRGVSSQAATAVGRTVPQQPSSESLMDDTYSDDIEL